MRNKNLVKQLKFSSNTGKLENCHHKQSCSTIAFNNCQLQDLRLRILRNWGIQVKGNDNSNYSLIPSLLAENSILHSIILVP